MSRQAAVLVITALAVFMGFLDATIVNIAFPDIERSFPDTSRSDLTWVLNAYNIVFAAFMIPAGRYADRIGRKRLFLGGLGLFALASAACAAAPSVGTLIAARIVQAVGAAIVVPTSLALVLPEFPEERRATAVGLWGIGAAVAAATGPSLGGLLIDQADWRLVFLVNLPVAAVVFVWGRRTLREGTAGEGRNPDLVGAALLAGAVGALSFAILKAEEWGLDDARVLAALAGTLAGGALFALRSRRHAAPVIEPALLRVRGFAVANFGTLAFATTFYGTLLCNVLFLTTVWQYSILTAGAAMTPTPLATAILAGPCGRLADRFGHRALIVPGCVVYAAGIANFVFRVGAEPQFVGEWLPGAVLCGIGIGMAFPVLTSAAVDAVPSARFATGSALNATARQLGAVLGITVLVGVVGTPTPADARDAFDSGWTAMIVAVAIAGMISLGVRRRPQPAATPAAAAADVELVGAARSDLAT